MTTTFADRVAAIDTAVERAGGILAFARSLKVKHQSVYHWKKRGSVPLARAVAIEGLYGIDRYKLIDPDLAETLRQPSMSADDIL